MELKNETWLAFRQHVLDSHPNEACGLIVNDEYIAMENVSEDPRTGFKIDTIAFTKIDAKDGVQAVLHSHTHNLDDGPPKLQGYDRRSPSKLDMITQQALDIPFGISNTEGENVSPLIWMGEEPVELLGRIFVHGIWDCYSVIRDWYHINRQITLRDHPREFMWWTTKSKDDKPENMYDEGVLGNGWYEIDVRDIEEGDGVIMKYQANVSNHAGLYVGNNKMIHHLYGHLSEIVSFSHWQEYVVGTYRYGEKK